jgi:hypothetical protein
MASNDPLIQLEEGGVAPVLRYDVPEPTSYDGKHFLRLTFDHDVFLPAASEMPGAAAATTFRQLPRDVLRAELDSWARTGTSARAGLPSVPTALLRRASGAAVRPTSLDAPFVVDTGTPTPPPPPPPPPDDDLIDGLLAEVLAGKQFVTVVTVDGEEEVEPVPVPTVPDPHLYLIESIRLSSFLGDYGAGRIVKTFSLLPGEVTRISMRTFRQQESSRKAASSVLDSLTNESAQDLQTSVVREQSDQRSFGTTSEYYADAEASARWGWGDAKVSAGVKGSSNAAREESVKNVANATAQHTARASAKREVEVNTSSEASARSEDELSIEREIENINLSRTLNFVFRQMNQEFTTALHLTDVRVAFFNGDRASRREVPLSRLDDLLEEVVLPGDRDEVRAVVLEQLEAVRDRLGVPVAVVERVEVGPGDSFLRFDPALTSLVDDGRGRTFTVPGLLLHQDRLVMRTEGVVVEALLGNGAALDGYAEQLQGLEVEQRGADVALATARAAQLALVNDVIADGDDARADRVERLVARCCPAPAGHAADGAGDGADDA